MRTAIIQVNGETWNFKAKDAPLDLEWECKGCIFASQRVEVCHRAAHEALLAGQPDCDDPTPKGGSYIYVIDGADPRQMDLLELKE